MKGGFLVMPIIDSLVFKFSCSLVKLYNEARTYFSKKD